MYRGTEAWSQAIFKLTVENKTSLQVGLTVIPEVHFVAEKSSLCSLIVSVTTAVSRILAILLENAMLPINDNNH